MPMSIIFKNLLLRRLNKADFENVIGGVEKIILPKSFIISNANVSSIYTYFLESGVGSIFAVSRSGQRAEIGLFGREGMSPTAQILGADGAPLEVSMQTPGEAWRIESDYLIRSLKTSDSFKILLLRYIQVMNIQTAFIAMSNSLHSIERRAARWILMVHDRTDGNQIDQTHEFLSQLLAVRRASITIALQTLEGRQFIAADRGCITIRDRTALQIFAGDAYGTAEAEYARVIEGPRLN